MSTSLVRRATLAVAGLGATVLAACGSDAVAPDLDLRNERVPACASPAPLLGQRDPLAPLMLVMYKDGVDATAETARLAQALGFTPTHVYGAIGGFAAALSPDVTAAVRCAPSVRFVEHDAVVSGS